MPGTRMRCRARRAAQIGDERWAGGDERWAAEFGAIPVLRAALRQIISPCTDIPSGPEYREQGSTHSMMTGLFRNRSAMWRWGATLLVWLVALALTIWFAPLIQRAHFLFFWVAVLFAAWYSGFPAA